MTSEICPNCQGWTLFKTLDNEQMVCSKCEYVFNLNRDKITNVIPENKMKHFDNVIKDMLVHTLSDSQIERAKVYVDEQITIAKYGNGTGNKGKWRNPTFERFERELSKWLKEFLNHESVACKSAEFEIINKMFKKPLLSKGEIISLSLLFKQYTLYLHRREIKLTINYNQFFHEAFKVLNIDALILTPGPRDKARKSYLMELWEGFLNSHLFTDYFDYKEPPLNCLYAFYVGLFINPEMAKTFMVENCKQRVRVCKANAVCKPKTVTKVNGVLPTTPNDHHLVLGMHDVPSDQICYCFS